MNKQELIKEFREVGIYSLNIFGTEIKAIPTEIAITSIEQLDEQKPVKVPQCVAEYINFQKKNNFHVYGAMRVIEDHYDKKVPEWFYEKNIETFARAWLDGYEVEKESKYRVKLKNTNDYLNETEVGFHFYNNWKDNKTFTRKELEYSDFGWVFDCPGIEIEEVE